MSGEIAVSMIFKHRQGLTAAQTARVRHLSQASPMEAGGVGHDLARHGRACKVLSL